MSDSEGEGPQRDKQLKIVILGDGSSGKVVINATLRYFLVFLLPSHQVPGLAGKGHS